MRKSNLERLRDAKKARTEPMTLDLKGLTLQMLAGHLKDPRDRKINPTQWEFICDPERYKAYMGAAGVAKTSTIVAAGLLRALLQPGSKGFVGRADYNDLMDTTMGSMERLLQNLPKGVLVDRDKSPPMKWWIQPVIPDGEVSQITFMGMKDNIGSYEFNWGVVDEADEVDEKRILELDSRLRAMGGNYALMLAFNPPDTNHHLYTLCTGYNGQGQKVREPLFKLYRPQPNENADNLPYNYHENLRKSLPADMVQRLVDGEWGAVFPGKPVYREFKYDLHSAPELPYDAYSPIYRFWDFGYRHPACIWAQLDFHGRLLVLKEHIDQDLEIRPFAQRVNDLTLRWFPKHENYVYDYGDPAARQKKDTGSSLVELSKEGITLRYKLSHIEDGVRRIRTLLEKLVDGKPAIMFARQGCPTLINAMRGGYRMDDKGEKPLKDGYYDHPADAFRYGIVNLFGLMDKPTVTATVPDSIAYGG